MRDQYIKSGDGFLLVYSITDHLSSHSITAFHEQIIAARGEKDKIIPQIPIVLVGNKVRLTFLLFFLHVYFWLSLFVCWLVVVFVVVACSGGDLSFRSPFRKEGSREFFWRVAIIFYVRFKWNVLNTRLRENVKYSRRSLTFRFLGNTCQLTSLCENRLLSGKSVHAENILLQEMMR